MDPNYRSTTPFYHPQRQSTSLHVSKSRKQNCGHHDGDGQGEGEVYQRLDVMENLPGIESNDHIMTYYMRNLGDFTYQKKWWNCIYINDLLAVTEENSPGFLGSCIKFQGSTCTVIHKLLPSLKLTYPLKMDGWKTIVSFWGPAYFQGG